MSELPRHPYATQPPRAFWSRAVAKNWSPADLIVSSEPLLRPDDKIVSAGSCFAANIVPFFETVGYEYVRTEFVEGGDKYGYGLYSAAYGNIYTPRQLKQLIERALGRFTPQEDRWHQDDLVIDPFRPGLADAAGSDEEFDLITRSHLDCTIQAIQTASVLIFTLGLTEAWVSRVDGAVFPACPGTVAGTYDAERHAFVNLTAAEVCSDLAACIGLLKEINPALRIMLTVSPVPLVATATGEHVYRATTYSKSVLRVACEEVSQAFAGVRYFPAYEIVTGPYSEGFFEADRRSVSQKGIQTVMDALFQHSDLPTAAAGQTLRDRIKMAEQLSRRLSERECEEVASDR